MLAYFDLFSGISGDMTLGALIDMGVPLEWLEKELQRLPVSGFSLNVYPVKRAGISACKFDVHVTGTQKHRSINDIREIITASPCSTTVKDLSLAVFQKLAEVEAGIHDCPVEAVHFHEVGAVDAIVDIVGTALCLEYLGVDRVFSSPVPLSRGTASCAHGTLPVPAPATMALLKGVPVYGVDVEAELVTPTGAALITTLAEGFGSPPPMVLKAIGYGAGSGEISGRPNVLRVVSGNVQSQPGKGGAEETICVIESTIDDMNPEHFSYLTERLMEDGALDVALVPVYMKKNRPGNLVQIICRTDSKDMLIERLLSETTSLGVRYHDVYRRTLERRIVEMETRFGKIPVKQISTIAGSIRYTPEYEVCRRIAKEKEIPIREVYEAVMADVNGQSG